MKKHFLFAFGFMLASILNAQENRKTAVYEDGNSLEDKIHNPIANMASIPLNYDLSINDDYVNSVNLQPTIPVKLSKNLLLVTQANLPLINAQTEKGYENGVGNTTILGTLTTAKQSDFSWGFGPAFMLPSGLKGLGFDKLSIGPSVIALKQTNGFTYGLILQNYFSVAGPSNTEDVNYLNSQIILSKRLNRGWYVYSNPYITANWNAPSKKQWEVPIGAGAGKLITHNRYLPINLKAGVYKYLSHPTNADWLVQMQATFIIKQN
ncbi:MAG TPA: hypothetical protein VKY41_01280 [Xanthomarina sp.]|nr:hypothetical protein [Xanthomarina sp.]